MRQQNTNSAAGAATICPVPCFQLGTDHIRNAGYRTQSVNQVWSSSAFPFQRYGWFSVTALIGLVTLTFDLSTSNWGHGSPCHGLPSCRFSASVSKRDRSALSNCSVMQYLRRLHLWRIDLVCWHRLQRRNPTRLGLHIPAWPGPWSRRLLGGSHHSCRAHAVKEHKFAEMSTWQ